MPQQIVAHRLGLGPSLVRYHPYTLLQGDQLIGWEAPKRFAQPVWPIHVQAGRSEVSQAEVQTGIVARIETGLAEDGLCLSLPSIMGEHPRTDRASIRFDTFQLHLNPVLFSADIVAQ